MFKRTLTHHHRIMTAIKISVDLKVPFSETNATSYFLQVFGRRLIQRSPRIKTTHMKCCKMESMLARDVCAISFFYLYFENLTLHVGGTTGGGILSGFTHHYPTHLILNSVIDPKG